MSRALLVALCACLAAGSGLRSVCLDAVCPTDSGRVCCHGGMEMDVAAGTCSNATYTCGLCGQGDMESCPQCPSPDSPFGAGGDEEGKWCVAEAKASTQPPKGAFVGSGSLPINAARSDGTATTLATFNGMEGWFNIETSTFQGFQEFLLGLLAQIPHFTQSAGFTITLRCLQNTLPSGALGCSLFFFIYRCPPCAAHTGNLEEQLLASVDPVWSVNPCGPTFKVHPEGVQHQFAMYSTEVPAPFIFSVELEQDIAFTWWAVIGQEVVCSSLAETECNDNPINCVWDSNAGECVTRGCNFNGGNTGPGLPRCSVCVDDELIAIPDYTN